MAIKKSIGILGFLGVLTVTVCAALGGFLHQATAQSTQIQMELEKNKAIARRFSQILGKADLGLIDELASPEITVYYPAFPQVIKGVAAFKERLTRFRAAFGDADMPIEEEIAEGDRVVLRWSFSATHQAEYPPGSGIPPTGKRVKWTGITIYRIVDGKVVDERGEEDIFGLMRQLGVIPKPPTQ